MRACLCESVCPCVCASYLLLVPHGALPADHDFTSRLCLQLLGSESPRAQDTAHEVELPEKDTRVNMEPQKRLYRRAHKTIT